MEIFARGCGWIGISDSGCDLFPVRHWWAACVARSFIDDPNKNPAKRWPKLKDWW